MRKNHVVFDFIEDIIPEKIEFSRNTCMLMDENPNFVTPDVPLSEIRTKTDSLEKCYQAALNGGKTEIALMRKTEKEWDELMRVEALYVDRIANGDATIILGAGFRLVRQPSSPQKSEFSLEFGERPGSVILHRKAVKGAKSYIWQFCTIALPETPEGWLPVEVTSKANVEINNLTLEIKYWFRVAVVTPRGTSAFSAPIMQIFV